MSRSAASLILLIPCLLLIVALNEKRDVLPQRLQGVVVTQSGGVPGARVRFQGEKQLVESDARGRFRLPVSRTRKRITAAKPGCFNASAWSDSEPLRIFLMPLPGSDFEQYPWIDATPNPGRHMACGNCHGEIYREWNESAHARAGNNRRLINLYDGSTWESGKHAGWSLLREHPDGAGVCAACHAPTMEPDAAGDHDLRRARNLHGLSGVHCDYCHKIQGPADGPIGLTHGRFGLHLLRPKQGQLFFGPLDDVDRGEEAWSPFQRESRYCASCHEGTLFGVPVYTTYSEWLESPAAREGKQCQDCHMAPTGRMSNIAPGHGGIERDPKTLANHRFFDESLGQMLTRSLRLDLTADRTKAGVEVHATLTADNVGHRVPTGFVDRHLLLLVQAFDTNGHAVLARMGPTLPQVAGRDVAGQPGRLYAKQLRDFEGQSPAPFWRADPEPIDTRLRPRVPDVSRYVFPEAAVTVHVRVVYRRFWPQVAEIKGWPENEVEAIRIEKAVPHGIR